MAWIRNMGEENFPDAIQILDLYHLCENIYDYAKALFNDDATQYKPRAEELLVLQKRLKQAGMQWDESRAQNLLTLRANMK